MDLAENVIVVTGAASGIGAAMAQRFADEAPELLVLADVNTDGLAAVAASMPQGTQVWPVRLDVSAEPQVRTLVDDVFERAGRLDLYCSNAGVATGAGVDADDSVWERTWSVNVMGSVYAARALLAHATPERRSRLLVTASAAGLLTNLGDAPYSVTKHGAVALAEWLAIHHHDDGLDVLLLCPQGVRTPMVTDGLAAAGPGAVAAEVVESLGLIEPAACADAVAEGLADDRFLILPHPEVADYAAARARDPQRWIAGMRRLLARLSAAPNP